MSPRILVVDDDPAICVFIEALLSRKGYACERVGDGDTAVRALRSGTYDAVVLDLMLPGTWGFDIIRFLNAEQPAVARRVVVITAASSATLAHFDVSSVHALIRKPFDIDELVDAVEECVGAREDGPPPAVSERRVAVRR